MAIRVPQFVAKTLRKRENPDHGIYCTITPQLDGSVAGRGDCSHDNVLAADVLSLAYRLMSGLAMFALKEPSLLAFDQRRQQDEQNLRMIFHMEHVPCHTRLREILDPVVPEQLRPAFRNVFT